MFEISFCYSVIMKILVQNQKKHFPTIPVPKNSDQVYINEMNQYVKLLFWFNSISYSHESDST